MIRDASEQAAQIRIELTDYYLALIDCVEALPQNQPGADKSGRWLGSIPDLRAALSRVRVKPK